MAHPSMRVACPENLSEQLSDSFGGAVAAIPAREGATAHRGTRETRARKVRTDRRGSRLDFLPYAALRLLSHDRNLETRAQVVARHGERPYSARKAHKHISTFRRHATLPGARFLDVGCGHGDLCIGLAKEGAARVVGIDEDSARIEYARRLAEREGVADRVEFRCVDFVAEYDPEERFDHVLSVGTFEHILDPLACLSKIRDCLDSGGSLLTRFGPLWLSPFGGHMHGFTPLPWVHLLLPERVVLRVRSERYRPDEVVDRYEDIVGHLNRMTVREFRRVALEAGFRLRAFRVNPEKDRKWGGLLRPLNAVLNRTPGLREFGALSLLAVLQRP